MVHPLPQVNRGWRRLPPVDLETLILTIRRSAVDHRLSLSEWQQLDRMRKRLARLRREEGSI
jgi:hypothetical protein